MYNHTGYRDAPWIINNRMYRPIWTGFIPFQLIRGTENDDYLQDLIKLGKAPWSEFHITVPKLDDLQWQTINHCAFPRKVACDPDL